MKLNLIAVGSRMPEWVKQGTHEYEKRIKRELGFQLIEVPLARRHKSADITRCRDEEGQGILARVAPADHVIALEVSGRPISTEDLALRLADFRLNGQNLSLLVGGPDGLSEACRDRANEQWSLSALTLPHPLVRILLVEQFYRAWSILNDHPYHRE